MPPYLAHEWVAAGAAVLAVVVGPIVSLYLLRRQNEAAERVARMQINASLVSASRQAWIDKLRDCIAEFQALTLDLGHRGGMMNVNDEEDARMQRALFLRSRIALLINPGEPDHSRLLSLIDTAISVSHAGGAEARQQLTATQHEITALAQTILKREWLRVKEGEPQRVAAVKADA